MFLDGLILFLFFVWKLKCFHIFWSETMMKSFWVYVWLKSYAHRSDVVACHVWSRGKFCEQSRIHWINAQFNGIAKWWIIFNTVEMLQTHGFGVYRVRLCTVSWWACCQGCTAQVHCWRVVIYRIDNSTRMPSAAQMAGWTISFHCGFPFGFSQSFRFSHLSYFKFFFHPTFSFELTE